MNGKPSLENISTKVARIAELAKTIRNEPLTSLSHHIDLEWLQEAFRRTRKDGAAGVDGQSMDEYANNLEGNLRALLDQAKSGRYRAPPVRRVHIPKGSGRGTRPIGIPTVEDKILQRAVVMALEPVYEQTFYECSYGFRPGRGAHDALQTLWQQLMSMGGGWVLEADIEGFFDSVVRSKLQEIVRQRVRDGVLLRLIGKWLNAGVLENGQLSRPETGTPQGGVISPLLANIYLHEVLDDWYERDVKPRLQGRSFLVRYADDFVIVFEREDDARRVATVLPKRFEKYGLRLHSEKTRLIEFHKPKSSGEEPPDDHRKGSFDLLGFTHFWAKSQKGNWVVKRKTASDRFSRALKSIDRWCRRNRHLSVAQQHWVLSKKLIGHDAYYGVIANGTRLAALRHWVRRIWKKWLSRRSNKHLTWQRMQAILRAFPLPPPRLRAPSAGNIA